MSDQFGIQFQIESGEAAEQFIHGYILEAVERLAELEGVESVDFAPGKDIVILGGVGDPTVIVEEERERWNSFVDDGRINGWSEATVWDEAEMAEISGEKGAELKTHLNQLSTQMAILAYETFDAEYQGPEAAEARIDDLIDDLDQMRDDVTDGRLFTW